MNETEQRPGRPRSEQARTAVLHAVDDLLVEVGYAALTMKGIAERAGVGRQTVYRWWSTKAEVLFEAAMTDAAKELVITPRRTTRNDFAAFVEAVTRFLTASDAGAGYRALVGEAQHDSVVAAMMRRATLFDDAAAAVVARAVARGDLPADLDVAAVAALLCGPVFFAVFAGGAAVDAERVADAALAAVAPIG